MKLLMAKLGAYLLVLLLSAAAAGQTLPVITGQAPAMALTPQAVPSDSKPVTITFQDALQRARANLPQFQAAVTDLAVAHQDRVQARAAMLPSLSYTTGYLYTEGNGTPSGVYIANNAVHEYISQGNAHQALNLGMGQIAEYRRTGAAEALARAKAELATRGLVVTVVQDYYGYIVAQRKYASSQQAATEAERFLNISRQLERGGEVAHSDVIKAQLQFNDRQRDLRETQLNMDKARLNLAVLLFPNFNQNFEVVDDLATGPALPELAEIVKMAQKNNADLRAAGAALDVAQREVQVAWSAHLPTLTVDWWYGIDASHYATYTDGVRNLGYSAQATLSIPVWNWGALQSKVKQADLRRRQARLELTFAQKQALANVQAFYAEAGAARAQRDTLRSSAELAAESLRLTNLRYQAGEATALEVVDAQNTLVQARDAYQDGEARYRVAIANLQTLTGSF